MNPEDVKNLLVQALPDCDIEVRGDGRHFDVRVTGAIFAGKRPVQRQQMVYAALGPQIADGSIHAVNMQIQTPEEI